MQVVFQLALERTVTTFESNPSKVHSFCKEFCTRMFYKNKLTQQNEFSNDYDIGKQLLKLTLIILSKCNLSTCNSKDGYRKLWQYGLWNFQTGGIKLERFLPKNQNTQRKFLNFGNFENWTNREPQYLAKIRVFKRRMQN